MAREMDFSALERRLTAHGTVTAPGSGEFPLSRGPSPRLASTPANAEALAAALAACDGAGAAAIPWGGGSQQRLGNAPERAEVVLLTSALNHLVEYEPANLTATVEVGMSLAEFQRLLAAHNQWLPVDPPLAPAATIGGLVATNVNGPRRIKEGGLRDFIIGTRVANADGTLSRAGGRVVKNVTGYDLNKLHIGALGTLGILVEVTFKVAPRPESERTWVGVFRGAAEAGRAALALARQPLSPSGMEILNDRAAAAVGLPVGAGRWALLARASGFAPAVARRLAEYAAAGARESAVEGEALEEGRAAGVWEAYRGLAAERRWQVAELTCRLAVPPAETGALCDRLAAVGAKPHVWAHGWGNLFWSAPAEGAFAGQVGGLRRLAEAAGGRLVVENWPDDLAGLDVWGEPAGPLAVMRAIKAQYDPRRTLNPGRYVGGI